MQRGKIIDGKLSVHARRRIDLTGRIWAVFAALIVLATGSATLPCEAQNSGMPYGGFRSYCNTGPRNYSAPMGGTRTYNSFNSGFSGFSQTTSGATYNTQRSTQAAESLAHNLSAMWSKVLPKVEQMG